jgi:hypothetical protein
VALLCHYSLVLFAYNPIEQTAFSASIYLESGEPAGARARRRPSSGGAILKAALAGNEKEHAANNSQATAREERTWEGLRSRSASRRRHVQA